MGKQTRTQDRVDSTIHKVEFDIAVARCIRVLLGNPNRGTPSKTWVTMTPTRYGHCVELLREGKFTPAVIEHATNVINTSSWLKKPIGQVSDADVAALLRDKPWERKTGTAEYAGPQQKGVLARRG